MKHVISTRWFIRAKLRVMVVFFLIIVGVHINILFKIFIFRVNSCVY